jgi:hypothetical protein
MAPRIKGRGKSIRESSWVASSAKVPCGEPCRNWEKGILTAPVRNCSTATLADKENITPGRIKTCAARPFGSRERISFNGNSIIPLACLGAGSAARSEAGADTAVLGAGLNAAGAEAIGVRAGAATAFSAIGATVGGGLTDFENNFLKRPNMARVSPHTASTQKVLGMFVDGNSQKQERLFLSKAGLHFHPFHPLNLLLISPENNAS